MADKTITCKDCGKEFIFTEGEQTFYKEKGFENDPMRCPECRKALAAILQVEKIQISMHKKSVQITRFK